MSARQILVVDDEELIRWSLAERLRLDGHEILEAGTAAQAFELLDGHVDAGAVSDALKAHVHDRHPGTELMTYRTGHRGDALLIGVE